MVFNVWKCQNCLSMVHLTKECTSRVRCRRCFRLGHRAKGCSDSTPSPTYKWVPRIKSGDSSRSAGFSMLNASLPSIASPAGSLPSPVEPATPSIPPLPAEPPPITPQPPSSPSASPPSPHPSHTASPPYCATDRRFSSLAPAMATFVLDPMEFVPQGFDIIDGGELRLPRTFFALAVAPDRQHEDYAIAIVEPAPLPE